MTEHESRDKGINRAWVFLGGCLAGVAGVFVAAAASELGARGSDSKDTVEGALPALPQYTSEKE